MHVLVLVAVAGVLAQGQSAGEERDANLRRQVNRLVRQLDADELADREAAEKELVELGPGVLDVLPATNNRTPAEVRQRLARVVKELEGRAAQSLTTPAKITLKGTLTLADALKALEEQSGNRIAGGYDEQADSNVTCDFKEVPYWDALDQILDQVSLDVRNSASERNALQLVARTENLRARRGAADYAGVLRVEPVRVRAQRDLRNPDVQGLNLDLQFAWEPRLSPILIGLAMDSLEVEDETGAALGVDGTGERRTPLQPNVSAAELELPLRLPARAVTKLAKVRGELTLLVPGRVETFEFTGNLQRLRGAEVRRAGASVVLDRVRASPDLFEIRLRLRFDESSNAMETHQGWIYNNEAYLVDASGKQVKHAGLEASRQDANEVALTYLFPAATEGGFAKFVYRTPAVMMELPVKFEVREVPLP